jgi:hypothetical protein
MKCVRHILWFVSLSVGLAACSSDENPQLMNLKNPGEGPDEFLIVPNKLLVMPEDTSELPIPTPGGTNLAGATPEADMVAALGGDSTRGVSGNAGLINYSNRFGTAPNIRADLALSDLEYRRRNNGRFFERAFKVSVYYDAYAPQSLDQGAELERFRRAGIKTPSAPPFPVEAEEQ